MSSNQKSLQDEIKKLNLAREMLELGARIPMLEAETGLPRYKLSNLSREMHGDASPRGIIPFKHTWFRNWLNNIESSLFHNLYKNYCELGEEPQQALLKAYRLFQRQMELEGREPKLSFSRAWTLEKLMSQKKIQEAPCKSCSGIFVVADYRIPKNFHCPICKPPPNLRNANIDQTPLFMDESSCG